MLIPSVSRATCEPLRYIGVRSLSSSITSSVGFAPVSEGRWVSLLRSLVIRARMVAASARSHTTRESSAKRSHCSRDELVIATGGGAIRRAGISPTLGRSPSRGLPHARQWSSPSGWSILGRYPESHIRVHGLRLFPPRFFPWP